MLEGFVPVLVYWYMVWLDLWEASCPMSIPRASFDADSQETASGRVIHLSSVQKSMSGFVNGGAPGLCAFCGKPFPMVDGHKEAWRSGDQYFCNAFCVHSAKNGLPEVRKRSRRPARAAAIGGINSARSIRLA